MYSRKLEVSATNVRLNGSSACFEDLNTLIQSYSVVKSDDLPVRLAYSPGAVPGDRVRLSTTSAGYATTAVAMDTFLTTVLADHSSVQWWARSAIDANHASMTAAQAVNGTFFIRHGGRAGAFILTYLYEGDLHSDCILSYTNTQAQFMLYLSSAGRSLSFPSLRHLVHYYSSSSRDLLCPLRLQETGRRLIAVQRSTRPPPASSPATRALSPITDVSEPTSPINSPPPVPETEPRQIYAPTLAREPRSGRIRNSSSTKSTPVRKQLPTMAANALMTRPVASSPPLPFLRSNDDVVHNNGHHRRDLLLPQSVKLGEAVTESRSTPLLTVSESSPRALRRTLSSELDATMAADRQLKPILKTPAKLKKAASEPQRVVRVNFADDLEQVRSFTCVVGVTCALTFWLRKLVLPTCVFTLCLHVQVRRMSPAPDWSWYQVGRPRYLATSALRGMPEGSFVIRRSESQPACFALTYKAKGQYWDELIVLPSGHLTGPDVHVFSLPQHRFPNFEALIVQFASPGSPLVCPLAIPSSFAAHSASTRGSQSLVSAQSPPSLRSIPLPKGGSAPQLRTPSSIVKSPARSPLTTTTPTFMTPNPHAAPSNPHAAPSNPHAAPPTSAPRQRQRHSSPQILPPRSTPRSRSRRARTQTAVTPTSGNQHTRATRNGFQPVWLDIGAQQSRWCFVQATDADVRQASLMPHNVRACY
jgi:hypothetical protein